MLGWPKFSSEFIFSLFYINIKASLPKGTSPVSLPLCLVDFRLKKGVGKGGTPLFELCLKAEPNDALGMFPCYTG